MLELPMTVADCNDNEINLYKIKMNEMAAKKIVLADAVQAVKTKNAFTRHSSYRIWNHFSRHLFTKTDRDRLKSEVPHCCGWREPSLKGILVRASVLAGLV